MNANTLALDVESLESRRMLAGNVTVELDDGDLEIRGERNTDQAIVLQAESDGSIRIFGLNGETTINDATQFIGFNVTGDIDINLRSGRGVVVLTAEEDRFEIGGDLEIDGSNQEDIVILNEIFVAGEVDVNTRGGNDAVSFKNIEVVEETDIRTGGGDDVFVVYGQANEFNDEFDIRTGGGDDGIIVSRSETHSELDVRAGGGEDRISLFQIASNDEIEVSGGGRDDVFLTDDFNEFASPVDLSSIEFEEDSLFGTEFVFQRNSNDTMDDLSVLLTFLGIA